MARADTVMSAIRWKPELHERLAQAAADREVSLNWLVGRLCEEGLDRLIPVSELRLLREAK